MLNKITSLFQKKPSLKDLYMQEHNIEFDEQLGYRVDGIVLNQDLSERLTYLSNRRLSKFDDLKELYYAAMLINEKIDLEIAQERFNERIGNTEENLKHFKSIVQRLSEYYRQFLREKK